MLAASPHRRIIVLAAVALVLAAFVSLSEPYAAAPNFINYRGILTDPEGKPVDDSTYAMHFAIYRDPSGGTAIWWEDHAVPTKNGGFHASIDAYRRG